MRLRFLGSLKTNQNKNNSRDWYRYISSDINTLWDLPFNTPLKGRHFAGLELLELTSYSLAR